jgi:hypothetical protein
LIELAKRDVDNGQPHLAQVLLEEHRARFPNGAFAGERDGLLVLLACARGSAGDRRQLAESFARSHPGSPLNDRIARACGTGSPAPSAPVNGSQKSFPPEIDK